MIDEGHRPIVADGPRQERIERGVQPRKLVAARASQEERRLPRKSLEGAARDRIREAVLSRGVRHHGGSVQVEHRAVAQRSALQIAPFRASQKRQGVGDVSGTRPEAHPVAFDSQRRTVLANVGEHGLHVRHRLPRRARDGNESRGGHQLGPGNRKPPGMTCLDGSCVGKRRRVLPARPFVVLQPNLICVGMTFPNSMIMPYIEHPAQSPRTASLPDDLNRYPLRIA